jgi:predicted transcriptional regulator YdeE/predicted enzyme related to lactoylglutathione lyase
MNTEIEPEKYPIRMEIKPSFKIVGEIRKTSLRDNYENQTVFRLMNQFFSTRVQEVAHRVNSSEFYCVLDHSEDGIESGHFSSIAAVEVSTLENIPEGMVERDYPTLLYAVLAYRGTAEGIHEAFDFYYQTWLPSSQFEMASPFSFQFHGLNYMGPMNPDSVLDIYFPIRPKAAGSQANIDPTKFQASPFQFGAVFVPVSDMPRAVIWYSNVLGIPIKSNYDININEKTIYDFKIGSVGFLLDNIGTCIIDNPNVLFYLKVPNIQQSYQAFKQEGIDIITSEHEFTINSNSFIVRDPDGNKITFLEINK